MKRFRDYCLLTAIGLAPILIFSYGLLSSSSTKGRTRSVARLREQLQSVLGDEQRDANDKTVHAELLVIERARVAGPEQEDPSSENVRARWEQLLLRTCERFHCNPQEASPQARRPYGLAWRLARHIMHSGENSFEEMASLEALLEENLSVIRETTILAEWSSIKPLRILSQEPCPRSAKRLANGNMIHINELKRLLAADAFVKVVRGDYPDALREIIAGLKLDDLLSLTWILPHGLLEEAADEMFRQALDRKAVSWELYRPLVEQLANGRDREDFAEEIAGMAREHIGSLRYLPYNTLPDGPFYRAFGRVYRVVGRPLIDGDARMYADAIRRIVELAPLRYYEAIGRLATIRTKPAGWHPGRDDFLWRFISLVEHGFAGQAYREVRRDMARIWFLLEQHRTEHGDYPTTLDSIAPALGGDPLVDPFSGEPYRYRLTDNTYFLYSVGPDQVDDGGKQSTLRTGTFSLGDGDLVWCGRLIE